MELPGEVFIGAGSWVIPLLVPWNVTCRVFSVALGTHLPFCVEWHCKRNVTCTHIFTLTLAAASIQAKIFGQFDPEWLYSVHQAFSKLIIHREHCMAVQRFKIYMYLQVLASTVNEWKIFQRKKRNFLISKQPCYFLFVKYKFDVFDDLLKIYTIFQRFP